MPSRVLQRRCLVFWAPMVGLLSPILLSLLLLPRWAVVVEAVPADFTDEPVVAIDAPLDMEFITYPDNTYKMLIVQREGYVYMVDDVEGDPRPNLILDLSDRVCDDGARGLLSILVHPNFATNRWIYLYYTKVTDGRCDLSLTTGPVNVVERYELTGGVIDVATRLLLLETSRTLDSLHAGGDMKFGKDGYLYITTGDGGHKPISQDKSDLMGSILRVTESGGIPPDGNAFTAADGYDNVVRCNVKGRPPSTAGPGAVCAEIWAKGLRNPFRFAMDPYAAETRFLIADVGGTEFEELSEGGTNFRGANYGWPVREGPWTRLGDTCEPVAEYVDPIYWYRHGLLEDSDEYGGAIIGGAFVPPGIWPPDRYEGKFIFADYVFDSLFVLTPQDPVQDGCTEDWVPAYSNATFHNWSRITGAHFGPAGTTQALYYLTRRRSNQEIRRIRYTGASANRAPVPLFSPNTTYAEVGEIVEFDGSASFDPDGDALRYRYRYNGTTVKWSRNPIYLRAFNTIGPHSVEFRVRDFPFGNTSPWIEQVVIVGPLPLAEITSPAKGARFTVGEVLTLSAIATTTAGDHLPDSHLTWEVRQHHSLHFHPFITRNGNDVVLPKAPSPEDLEAGTNSYLEIVLSATDPVSGAVRVVRRNVMPRAYLLTIDSVPPGLTLFVYDEEVVTPAVVTVWSNQRLRLVAADNPGVRFARWSNDGAEEQTIAIRPNEALSFTAFYT